MPFQDHEDTAEYKAFKACTSKLVSTIAGDLKIAEILLEEGLISDETYDYVAHTQPITDRTKASKLVSSIRNKIKADERNFNVFCDILEENNVYYDQLLQKLKEKQGEYKEVTVMNRKPKYSTAMIILIIAPVLLALYCHHPPERLVHVLKEYYKQLDEINFNQHLLKSSQIPFIIPTMRLADEIQETINVTKMLDSIRSGTRLAVIGRPGVGKSTLARHIVKMWARRSALQRFSTLFHICLGRANSTITGLQSLLEEECHEMITTEDSELETHQLMDRVKATKGEGVIFVLDGFDEYLPGKSVQKNDYIFRLIRNRTLSKSAIIITSRPRRVDEVKNYFTKIVELVGFNKVDIETSLLRLGTPLGPLIEGYFENNPNVKRICYLPLHMSMVIYLASLKKDPLSDIDSETKIYTNFLYLTINHYSIRHGLESSDLEDCFKQAVTTSNPFCPLFKKVCELAFNATIHRQQTFSSNEIKIVLISSDSLEDLSLFNIRRENRRQGSVEVFSFSHQTFRDFMSACYLAMLPESKQQQMIHEYGNVSFLRDFVWKFFFGLVGGKTSEQTLCNLFRTSVGSSGYRQLDSHYYVVDLHPLAYAFETGKRNETFADLLDCANITGTGNNHSLQIHLREPMEMKSFLNIDESGRINLLFMKYALKWTSVVEIKLKLQVQTIHPDPKLCTKEHLGLIFDQTIESTSFQEAFKAYCGMNESVTTDNIVLEVEYWRKQIHIDPQLIFTTLNSAILPYRQQAVNLKSQMIKYLAKQTLHYISQTTDLTIRPTIVLEVLHGQYKKNESDLNEEEISFIQLWHQLERYIKINSSYDLLNFSELKRLKLQQSLMDIDLKEICEALQSATKLEILDLSHNDLLKPKCLVQLLRSLKNLKVLDLSDNYIKLDFIAEGFKFLTRLQELYLSGNVINTVSDSNEGFGSHLKHLKELQILDLSGIMYDSINGFASGLRNLVNLRKLNLSTCMIRTDQDDLQLQKLSPHLKLLTKLEILDLSHNFIKRLPTEVSIALMQVKELNLSHNMLSIPLSHLVLFQSSFTSRSKLRKLNLSHNYLCADESVVEEFILKIWQLSKIQDVDLSNNTIIFFSQQYTGKNSLNLTIISSRQKINLDGVIVIPSRAKHVYATCVCKRAGFVDGYNSFCFRLFQMFRTPQESHITSASDLELKALHDHVALRYLTGIKRSTKGFRSIISDKKKRSKNRRKVADLVEKMQMRLLKT